MVSNSRALARRSLSAGRSQIEPPAALIPTIPSGTCRPELLGACTSLQRKNIPLCLQPDLFSHFSLCSTFSFTP